MNTRSANTKSIRTQRFILKELTKADATSRYLSWLNDENTSQYITHTQAQLSELAEYIDQHFHNPHCLFLGIFAEASDGLAHIGNVKYESMAAFPNIATMGILIGETNWHGKGVAKEVIEASLPLVKSTLHASMVNLGVEKSNVAAVKAYEKIGFEISKKPHYHFDDEALEMDINI